MKNTHLKLRNIIFVFLTLNLFSSFSFSKDKQSIQKYGLEVNLAAPDFTSTDIDGNEFNLKNAYKKGPIVLAFYRGGWCPYCNTQLRSLQSNLVPKLKPYSASLVVLSVDSLDEASKSKKSNELGMTVISDSDAKILKLYNVAFKVPNELVNKYKNEYKIDLEKSSGKDHHLIAVPSVFIINKEGKITYSYVDENYKTRANNKDILKALSDL